MPSALTRKCEICDLPFAPASPTQRRCHSLASPFHECHTPPKRAHRPASKRPKRGRSRVAHSPRLCEAQGCPNTFTPPTSRVRFCPLHRHPKRHVNRFHRTPLRQAKLNALYALTSKTANDAAAALSTQLTQEEITQWTTTYLKASYTLSALNRAGAHLPTTSDMEALRNSQLPRKPRRRTKASLIQTLF